MLVDHLVNGAGSHIAGNEVAVLGIPLLKEVEALGLGNLLEGALVARLCAEPRRGRLRRAPTPT